MTVYNYCSPEWLEESANRYSQNEELKSKLKKLSAKMGFKVTANPGHGLDNDIVFAAFIDNGNLTRLSFISEEEARAKCDYILMAETSEWSQILRKKFKFIARFMMQKVKLDHGEKIDVLKLGPYANDLVEVLTQADVRYPDEMSEAEIESFREKLNVFRSRIKV